MGRGKNFITALGLLCSGLLLGIGSRAAAEPVSPGPFTFDASLRTRYEFADWFSPPAVDNHYGFWHTKLLAGVSYSSGPFRAYLQGQYFQLYDLPTTASGPGAVYYATNGGEDNPGMVAARQILVAWKDEELEGVIGRFLYSNASEAAPKNPALAAVRAQRVAQRVIGPFDFTAGRSFDGGRVTVETAAGYLSGLYMSPTQGGFETDLNRTIDEVRVGTVSWTAPMAAGTDAGSDIQLFAYSYSDDRNVVKTDNRELTARTADHDEIEIGTVGGHFIQLWNTGGPSFDSLLWAVAQFGDWGTQDHAAWAYTAEVGIRDETVSWKPAARIGYTFGSGDNDPEDDDHTTFFQMLPTARAYAATPFYNMQNMGDLFLQLSAQPFSRLKVRGGIHWLQLIESADLLYSGAGASETRNRFGYAGTGSGHSHKVGTLLDIEATWTFSPHAALTAYYGHVVGSDVLEAASQGGDNDIDYLFFEVNLKS